MDPIQTFCEEELDENEEVIRDEIVDIWKNRYPFGVGVLIGVNLPAEINPDDFTIKGLNIDGLRVISDMAVAVNEAVSAYGQIHDLIPRDEDRCLWMLQCGLTQMLGDIYRLTFDEEPIGYLIQPLDIDLDNCADGVNALVDYLDANDIDDPSIDSNLDRICIALSQIKDGLDVLEASIFPDEAS